MDTSSLKSIAVRYHRKCKADRNSDRVLEVETIKRIGRHNCKRWATCLALKEVLISTTERDANVFIRSGVRQSKYGTRKDKIDDESP